MNNEKDRVNNKRNKYSIIFICIFAFILSRFYSLRLFLSLFRSFFVHFMCRWSKWAVIFQFEWHKTPGINETGWLINCLRKKNCIHTQLHVSYIISFKQLWLYFNSCCRVFFILITPTYCFRRALYLIAKILSGPIWCAKI